MLTKHCRSAVSLLAVLLLAGGAARGAQPDEKPQAFYKLEVKIMEAAEGEPLVAVFTNATLPIKAKLLNNLMDTKGVNVLAAPKIITGAGNEAIIRVQSDLQYFECQTNGSFALKTIPDEESPGVHLAATMNPAADSKVDLDIDFRFNILVKRKSIPGVSLDVGLPLMKTREIKTKIGLCLNQWILFGGLRLQDVSSERQEYLAILVRVTVPRAQ